MRIKQYVPVALFVVVALLMGVGLHKGFKQSSEPLVDPSHPKVQANDLPAVVLYSAEWCTYCKAAKSYFGSRQVPFIERDIEKSAQAAQAYRRLGGQGLPLITVNQHIIRGFDKAGFKAVYLNELALHE